jgi:hypothetical protein
MTLKGLIDQKIKFGVSSRGVGSTREEGDAVIVEDDLMLSAVDVVHDPSGPGCFVNPLSESIEWKYDTKKKLYIEKIKPIEYKSIPQIEKEKKSKYLAEEKLRKETGKMLDLWKEFCFNMAKRK